MQDWDDIRHFLAVARHGTLSAAARDLKVDHATVSRRLTALETALDVRLVDRLPRSCRLTAVGQQVFAQAKAMEAGAYGIARLASAAHAPLTSRVTLSAPPVLVTHLLLAHLKHFRIAHPDIRLSLSAQGQQISLSRREADIAVRLVRPNETGSVARKLGVMEFGLYASPAYPHLAAPERWQFVAFDATFADMPQQRWLLGIAGNRPIAIELNHINEHASVARAGVGVAGLPRFIGDSDRDLVRITADVPPFSRDIWLIVHRDLRRAPAVRAVMDFVAAVIEAHRDLSMR